MAYQNVSTPRFYVSILQYLKHFGLLTMTSEDTVQYIYNKELLSLADVNPSSQAIMNVPSAAGMLPIVYKLNDGLSFQNIMPSDQNFFMILGHKFAEGISDGRVKCYARTDSDDTLNVATTGVINFNDTYEADYNGFSISKGNDAHDLDDQIQIVISQYQGTFNYPIGCFLYGTYYDMTSSPNLSLKMSREYGNTDEQVTHNGSSFINQAWLKPDCLNCVFEMCCGADLPRAPLLDSARSIDLFVLWFVVVWLDNCLLRRFVLQFYLLKQ